MKGAVVFATITGTSVETQSGAHSRELPEIPQMCMKNALSRSLVQKNCRIFMHQNIGENIIA